MTARGAADFLTRATAILGAAFVVLSIFLAAIAGGTRESPQIDTSLARPGYPRSADRRRRRHPRSRPRASRSRNKHPRRQSGCRA